MADGEPLAVGSRPAAPGAVTRWAPAKVNLYLHVVGRRDDGYHLLDSLVVFAGVGDRVVVTPAAGITLSVDGPFADRVPTGPDNLVLKAAGALAARAGVAQGAAIRLTKRLPVAAGIGGGSADAAATIRALAALWGIGLAADAMAEAGLPLGADVPVCLAGIPAFVGGIGEDIRPAPALPPVWMVLVNPGVAVSTPQVFKARSGGFSAPGRFEAAPADARALFALLAERRNDLAPAARALAPAIDDVLAALARQPGCAVARMSGSGATCFGLFAWEGDAVAAAAEIGAAHPTRWVRAAPMLSADVDPAAAG